MSVFTKALSSPSSFVFQGAQLSSIFGNEELVIYASAKRQPSLYQRTCFGLPNIQLTFRYQIQGPSAVGVVCGQSQPEATGQGLKQRGRPRNKVIENGPVLRKKSAELQSSHLEENEQERLPGSEAREGHLFKYTEVVPEVDYQQFNDEREVFAGTVKHIADVSKESIRTHGWFVIALSGGSLVKALKGLANEDGIEWAKWHVLWIDERVVPLSDSDSNFKLAMEIFLSKAKIPKDQIHSIKYAKDASVVAKGYEQVMRGLVKVGVLNLDSSGFFPRLDLILLGIGPDGHVASLFPNSLALAEEKKWVVSVQHSPKPPPERISMTLPCINAASQVCFVVVGSSKAEVVQRVLERVALPGSLPAQMVRPSNGVLAWFVDKAAAGNLSVNTWEDSKMFPFVNYTAAKKLS